MSANSSYSPALLEADEAPFATEFLRHPDYRVTAGFLLGWVFWSSFYNTHQSRFFQQIGRVLWCFLRGKRDSAYANDVEAWAPKDDKCQGPDGSGQTSIPPPISNETALAFTLNLCFSFASFAKFCSILAYDPGGANTVCAFTVAWGSMADQAARLVGLLILTLKLKVRGTRRAEFLSLCAALVIALSFVLAFNATNTGDVVPIGSLMVAICVVDRYVPTAILTSATSVFLELYMVIRNLSWEDRTAGLFYMLRRSTNLRVAQASSLLLIDVLTVAPKVTNTNVLAQFVPFSLGALIVLIAFNRRAQDKTQVDSAPGGPSKGRSRRQTPGPLTFLSRSPPHPTVDSSPASSEKGDVIAIDTPMGQPCLVHSTRTASPVIVPSSAPPRIGDAPVFSDLQANQILPFQTQYAERLERHIHTGPIVPLRPKRQRPHIQVVVEDMELVKASPLDRAPSTIIGSDIIRLPSAVAAARKGRKAWSSGSAMTPSDSTNGTSSAATPTTTVRDSNLSMATSAFSRSAGGSRSIFSGVLSRQASQKARSPAETSLRMPWRSAPRASFASGRTFGGREELPAVTEGRSKGVGAGLSTGSWRHSQSSAKRLVISHPHSLRSSTPASPRSTRLVMKQLPAISACNRPNSSQHLTVPEHLRSPITAESPSSITPSSQSIVPIPTSSLSGSYGRVRGSGNLRGPRSPPTSGSSPNLRSAWPSAELDLRDRDRPTPGHMRRCSHSCPELPPLDLSPRSLRPGTSTGAQDSKAG